MPRCGDAFFDGVTVPEAGRQLKIKLRPVSNDGFGLLCAMTDFNI